MLYFPDSEPQIINILLSDHEFKNNLNYVFFVFSSITLLTFNHFLKSPLYIWTKFLSYYII